MIDSELENFFGRLRLTQQDSLESLRLSIRESFARLQQEVPSDPSGLAMLLREREVIDYQFRLWIERMDHRQSQQFSILLDINRRSKEEAALSVNEQQRARGKRGGMQSAAHWRLVMKHALDEAANQMPMEGWRSAELAASRIKDAVSRFARLHGRDFPGDPQRTIANWLRKAGVKRVKSTS